MKYHVHVHSLMTFGGIDNEGVWQYPKYKMKLCPHVEFRNLFRKKLIPSLEKYHKSGKLKLESHHLKSLEELRYKRWSYHVTKPSMSTQTIELYPPADGQALIDMLIALQLPIQDLLI